MSGRSWMAPLTGVVFVVLLIVSFAVSGDQPPTVDDSTAEEIVDFYADNSGAVIAGAIIGNFAAVFLAFFGAVLAKALRAAGADATANLTFAGSVVIALAAAIDGSISFALAEAAEDIDPVGIQTLAALYEFDFLPFALGLLIYLMGLGVAIVRYGVLPRWVGWVAIVASLTVISPAFFVGAIIALLITLAASVILTRDAKGAVAA